MSNFLLFQEVYSLLFVTQVPLENDLEHVLGFLEGDGGCCKQQKKKRNTCDFSYRITQRSVKILYVLKDTLHFGGRISPDPAKNPRAFSYRLTFTRKGQVLCFIALLLGNLRFVDRQTQFQCWAQEFLQQNLHLMCQRLASKLEKAHKGKIPIPKAPHLLYQLAESSLTPAEKKWYAGLLRVDEAFQSPRASDCPTIELETAWFSGFLEAEGTFRSQFYRRENVKKGYSVDLAIEIRQNNAYSQFLLLKEKFGGHLRSEGKSHHFRIASAKSVKLLKDYFIKHPLRGRKHVAQSRWLRAYALREKKLSLPPEGTLNYRRFVRLFQSVNSVKK